MFIFFEIFKRFGLVLQKVHQSISTEINSESYEVLLATSCHRIHDTTYITMCYSNHSMTLFHILKKGLFHLSK